MKLEPCSICPESYDDGGKESHLIGHDYLLFGCRACNHVKVPKLFATFEEIQNHIRHAHGITKKQELGKNIVLPRDARKMSCRVCSKKFMGQRFQAFSRHMAESHDRFVDQDKSTLFDIVELSCRFCPMAAAPSAIKWNQHFRSEFMSCSGVHHLELRYSETYSMTSSTGSVEDTSKPIALSDDVMEEETSQNGDSSVAGEDDDEGENSDGSSEDIDKKLYCSVCRKQEKSLLSMHNHLLSKDHGYQAAKANSMSFKCFICDETFHDDEFKGHLKSGEHADVLKTLDTARGERFDQAVKETPPQKEIARKSLPKRIGKHSKYYCGLCRIKFTRAAELDRHYKGDGHDRKMFIPNKVFRFYCQVCKFQMQAQKNSFYHHLRSKIHMKKLRRIELEESRPSAKSRSQIRSPYQDEDRNSS